MESDEETWEWQFLNLVIDHDIQNLEIQYKVFYDDDCENLDPQLNNSTISVQDVRNLISKFTTSTKYDFTGDTNKLFSSELDNKVSQSPKTSTGTCNKSSLSSTLTGDESKGPDLDSKIVEDDQIETSNLSFSFSTLPDGESEDPDLNSKSFEKPNLLSFLILPEDPYMESENETSNLSSTLLDDEIGDPDFSFKLNEEVQTEYDWDNDIKDFELQWSITDLF